MSTLPNPNPIPNNSVITYDYIVVPSLTTPTSSTSYSNIVVTQVNTPLIEMTKFSTPTLASIGTTITYTIIVNNYGNASANNIILIDTIPSDTSFVENSVSINGTSVVGSPAPPLGINLGTISIGEVSTVTFDVVLTTLPSPHVIINSATTSYNYTEDPSLPDAMSGGANSNIYEIQVIDTIPPTIVIVLPPDGSTVEGKTPIVISIVDNACISFVEIKIDGVVVDARNFPDQTRLEYSYLWDTTTFTEGPHLIEVTAIDCFGNINTTESTVMVDNLPDCYTQILLNELLKVPIEKPDIEAILNVNIFTDSQTVTRVNTIHGFKYIVTGTLNVEITYGTSSDDQSVHFFHNHIPFIGFKICNDIPLNTSVEAVIFNEYVKYYLLDDRTVNIYVVLFIGLKEN